MKPAEFTILMLFVTTALAGPDIPIRDLPVESTGDIQFYIDHAGFASDSGMTYEEFYLQLFTDQLESKRTGDHNRAEFSVDVEIVSSTGITVFSKRWIRSVTHTHADLTSSTMTVYDQWGESLAPGEYRCTVSVNDQLSRIDGTAEFTVSVPRVSENSSQIQFVSSVETADTSVNAPGNPFLKSGYTVYPNPSRRYGILSPVLYIYYELYSTTQDGNSPVSVRYTLQNTKGEVIHRYAPITLSTEDENISVIHGLNVSDIPSGIYLLSASFSGSWDSVLFSISRHFEVIQSDYIRNRESMDSETLDMFSHLLEYVASPGQYRRFSQMNSPAKVQFILQFFKDRDPTPDTTENEYLNQLQRYYRVANADFSQGNRKGWNTDRGRILIQYGFPDEVKRYDFVENLNPYEIWYYENKRAYIFVFGDIYGNGNKVLLHSNAEKEIFNQEWQRQLDKTF